MLPQLLGCLPADKVKAVQFLRGGIVRLTFEDEVTRNDVLARGISFQGIQLRVVSAMSDVRSLYVRDLPVEVPDDVVSSFLASFGDVVHVTRSTYKDFPSVCDGNRIIRIVLKQDVPYFLRIADCNCRVWYARQPVQCVICRESGHVGRDCPLSGRCRRCHQPGHVARLCTQAWGPMRSTSADVDESVDESAIDVDVAPPSAKKVCFADVEPESSSQASVSTVSPSQPCVVAVPVPKAPVPASSVVPVAAPVPSEVPAKSAVSSQSSKSLSRIELLKVVAKTHPMLRKLLGLVGHVVTESLLERIDSPMNSVEFFRSLVNLTRGRLDPDKQSILNGNFGNVRSFPK